MRFKPTFSILFFLAFIGVTASIANADLPMTTGTMTLTAITGYSRVEFPTDPTSGSVLKPVIYGGMANIAGATACTGTQSCDTCAVAGPGGANLYPCNRTSVSPSTKLHFDMTTTTAVTTYGSADVGMKSSTGTSTVVPVTSPTYNSSLKTLSFDVAWSDICAANSNTNCSSSGAFTGTFSIGFVASGALTDKIDIQITYSVIADADIATYQFTEQCSTAGVLTGSPGTGTYGYCRYAATRGDGKVYIDPLIATTTYPAYQGSVNYAGIEVFYVPSAGSQDTTVASIKTTSPHSSFSVPTGGTAISDNRVTGLSNGTEYCFVVANRDVTGNIFFYAPVTGTTPPAGTNVASADICATPDVVVGLLDDKHCFIATAAFGSQMAPEVETFRKFRNQFLLNSAWGRGFVKAYYKFSPPLANFISEHEILRAAARGLLWPFLLFAKLSLEWGMVWTALAAAILTMMLLEVFRRLRALHLQRKTL